MQKEKIVEGATVAGNKLIAEFMGGKLYLMKERWPGLMDIEFDLYYPDELAYHSSWDWLMPVVEKIELLPTDKDKGEQYQFSITGDGVSITRFDDGSGIIAQYVNRIGKSKLDSAYKCVIDFIKYYNANTPSHDH